MAADVQKILRTIIRPGDDEVGASVSLIAERAQVSTRTVYRVLQGKKLVNEPDPDNEEEPGRITTHTVSLDLADRLCLACGRRLLACRLKWPGDPNNITTYMKEQQP